MYYSTDDTALTKFPTQIGKTNPIYQVLKEESENKPIGLQEHFYEYINKYKVVELLFGGGGPQNEAQTSWRTFGGIHVNPNVLLYPENMNLQFKIVEDWDGSVLDTLKGKAGGLGGKMEEGMEFLRLAAPGGSENAGGKFVSKFAKVPAWKGGSGLQGPSSLKFKFTFGQAGLFSGLEEVVKPILAISSAFAPTMTGNYLKGPMPTIAEYMVGIAKEMVGFIIGGIRDKAEAMANPPTPPAAPPAAGTAGNEAVDKFNEAVGKITAFQDKLYGAIDTAIGNVLARGGMSTFYMRVGKMTSGPFFAKNCDFDFDFNHVDEDGYPTAGTLTLGSIETYMIADKGMVRSLFVGV